MAKDYSKLSEELVPLVGGPENIQNVFNCATRLRFNLKDIEIAKKNIEKIKNRNEVLDVIVQNGQFQVVIGPDVKFALDAINEKLNLSNDHTSHDDAEKIEKSKMDRFFEIVSSIFTPTVPVLMASGMMGAVITILNLVGVLSKTSSTYYLLNIVYEAGFYFLPFFIALSASRVFKANNFLAMLLAGIMLFPGLLTHAQNGIDTLEFLNIQVPTIDYGKAVLPVILGVWLLSYLERFFDKYLPAIIRSFMSPLLVMLIMLPIQLIIIGPLGTEVANILSSGVTWMGDNLGFFAVGLLAFFTPIMISTGTHSFAFPVIVATLTSIGYDQLLMPSMVAENLAMAGAACAIGVMAKNKEKKSTSFSASFTAVLGISEPAMYGINLPSKVGFVGAMFGGLVGGLFAGIFKFKMYMIASSSVIGIPAMFGPDGVTNVIIGLLTIVISFISAFLFTILFSKSNINFEKFTKKGE
ncbi:PTS transporter subunit EIIC [Enterococcus faecium]|uniref:PTS transporter subunit EIIC n=1 Tax=Enterococcus faecium TaxID=1352 RepID=UPI001574E75D|nr:PTS transporter subunit EIIC [Enterococcus faecium]MEB6144320.1 PTS transporter subunit EIIC [Enterococcus faecium]NTM00467.1 PTS transporter subunit EIIC [Enterococcus faecium]